MTESPTFIVFKSYLTEERWNGMTLDCPGKEEFDDDQRDQESISPGAAGRERTLAAFSNIQRLSRANTFVHSYRTRQF